MGVELAALTSYFTEYVFRNGGYYTNASSLVDSILTIILRVMVMVPKELVQLGFYE